MGRPAADDPVSPLSRRSAGWLLAGFLLLLLVPSGAIFWGVRAAREALTGHWVGTVRDDLSHIAQRVVRESAPQSRAGDALRRSLDRLRQGMPPGNAFRQLVRRGGQVTVMVFDGAGHRLKVTGLTNLYQSVSERVLSDLVTLSRSGLITPQGRKNSRFLFGQEDTVERLAANPRSLVPLTGNASCKAAGWWPIRGKAGRGRCRHLLILLRDGKEAFPGELRRQAARMEHRLGRWFRLSVIPRVRVAQARRVTGNLNREQVFTQTAVMEEWMEASPDLYLVIRQRVKLPMALQTWRLRLQRAGWAVVGTLALGLLWLARLTMSGGLARITLQMLVSLGILGVVVPAVMVFSLRAWRYRENAVERRVWQIHREIENRLQEIDQGMGRFRLAIESALRRLAAEGRTPDALRLPPPWDRLTPDQVIYQAFLSDADGVMEWEWGSPERRKRFRKSLAGLGTNLGRVMAGRSDYARIGDPVMDYMYAHGQAWYFLQRTGRILDLGGFEMETGLFIQPLPPRVSGGKGRFYIALIETPLVLRRSYLRSCRFQKAEGFRMGFVGTDEFGPVWSSPDSLLLQVDLLRLCERAFRTGEATDGRFPSFRGTELLVTAVPGRRMARTLLVGARDPGPILAGALVIGDAVLLSLGTFLGLAALSVLLLAGYFRTALQKVTMGMGRLQQRDFKEHLATEDGEFGELIEGINRAAHTLEEIVSAQPVQKTINFEGTLADGELDLAARLFTSGFLAGDFSEVLPLEKGRWLVAVGDTAGNGIVATLLAARIKVALGILADPSPDPGAILEGLRHHLAAGRVKNLRMTLVLLLVETGSGEIQFVNAGHCWPMRRSATGTTWVQGSQPPLGMRSSRRYSSSRLALDPGESLLLYTNGWIRSDRGEEGYDRFRRQVESAPDGRPEELLQWLENTWKGEPPAGETEDDRLAMVLHRRLPKVEKRG